MFRIIGSVIILLFSACAYFLMEKSDVSLNNQQPIQTQSVGDDAFKSFKID